MRTHIIKIINCRSLLLLAIILLPGCGSGLKNPAICLGPDSSSGDTGILTREGLDLDKVGYIVYDTGTGRVISSHNRNRAFIPASTTKLVTAVSALKVLGTDYRFKTILGYTGKIRSGTISGNMYLRGTGDPHLTVRDLAGLAEKLHSRGIRKIQGSFYFDEGDMPSSTVIDTGMDDNAAYNPGISALSCDSNRLFAQWKCNTKNKNPVFYLIPSLPMNCVEMSGDMTEWDPTFSYMRSRGRGTWTMSRPRKKQGRESLPVKNPGLYTAQIFSRLCAIQGIDTGMPVPGTMPGRCKLLFSHQGEKLPLLIDLMLTYSNNMMSELIIGETAQKLAGKPQGIRDAAATVRKHICSLLPATDWRGFNIVNGSGLTSKNSITPEQLCSVLAYADGMMPDDLPFMSFLPVSGWEWSLMTRLNSPGTAFRVYAKTGTIFYAVSIAGYMYTSSGKRLLLVFFITDREKRASYEQNRDRKNKNLEKNAQKWVEHSRDSMDRVIAGWISEL